MHSNSAFLLQLENKQERTANILLFNANGISLARLTTLLRAFSQLGALVYRIHALQFTYKHLVVCNITD
jgi:hypothetical protein